MAARMDRRAKIVATVGPASASEGVLARLLRAGVDVVRLNLSHGTREEHARAIQLVRRVAAAQRRHVAVLADLMGPRYRLGELPGGGRTLRRGERVVLGRPGAGVDLPVDDPRLLAHLAAGERVLIDNGLVELAVEARRGRTFTARVVGGGPVATRKGINLPDTDLPFLVSAKDRADAAFAAQAGADFLAASYVGRARDVEAVRRLAPLPIVAKLERALAIDNLEEIVEAADAVMVARGDLGVEVPLHRVPVLQKKIIAAGRRRGKPVIVATQMLESMMERPRPTRAEASDVANAVFDGADALMLSGETAAGGFPVEAVATMERIIVEAEGYRRSEAGREGWRPPAAAGRLRPGRGEPLAASDLHLEIPDTVCGAAVHAAAELGASHLVAFSQGGFTARMIARYRPAAPIVVFTREPEVARRLQLVWGVRPAVMTEEVRELHEVVEVVDRRLLAARLVAPGEPILILMGDPIRDRPLTNLLRIHRVRRR